MDAPFPHTIASLEELRSLYREPSALVTSKKKPELDEASQRFIAASPLLLIGTAGADGRPEVSPRGGPAGWVKVLDSKRLLIPDLNGNNLLDSLTNVVSNPYAGLLFIHPGKDETLRVNGRACLTVDEELLKLCAAETADGRTPTVPKAAVGVEITDVFIHCAKAFRRGQVWDPQSWAQLDDVDAIDVIKCQMAIDLPRADLLAMFAQGYAEELRADFE